MLAASKLKAGMTISVDQHFYRVLSSDYHSSGKMVTSVCARLKDIKTGAFAEKHFKPDEKIEEIHLDRKDFEFLYNDGDDFFFMNPDTFDQISLHQNLLGPGTKFLKANTKVPLFFFQDQPVGASLPETVQLKVALTSPALQQDNSTMKTAVLEGGIEVLVPQFIKTNDIVKIDINTNKYLERVKEDKAS